MPQFNLLNVGTNAKTVKSDRASNFLTGIMFLAPGNLSGFEVCQYRSPGCFASCLYYAGYGKESHVQKARIRKTKLFFNDRQEFMHLLVDDISTLLRRASREIREGIAIRLNGTSDIPWERIAFTYRDKPYKNIMAMFPQVRFYDYTKNPKRHKLPHNYRLIFSLDEGNEEQARAALDNGLNVAVVFKHRPSIFWGRQVIDGDKNDLRFLDPVGCIVGLKPKGYLAKQDETGFVHRDIPKVGTMAV